MGGHSSRWTGMNGRSFIDGLSLKEEGREGERKREKEKEKGRKKEKERERKKEDKERERKGENEREEREREEERGRERRTLNRNGTPLCPPMVKICQGSDEVGKAEPLSRREPGTRTPFSSLDFRRIGQGRGEDGEGRAR